MVAFTEVIRWMFSQLTALREGSAEYQTGDVEVGDGVAEDNHHDLSSTLGDLVKTFHPTSPTSRGDGAIESNG